MGGRKLPEGKPANTWEWLGFDARQFSPASEDVCSKNLAYFGFFWKSVGMDVSLRTQKEWINRVEPGVRMGGAAWNT